MQDLEKSGQRRERGKWLIMRFGKRKIVSWRIKGLLYFLLHNFVQYSSIRFVKS